MQKMYEVDHRYLKKIDFKTLDKWFVSYYLNPNNLKSKYEFIDLKKILKPSKERIKLKDFNKELRVVKKISFADGKIHLREENETKMDLYILNPNDLLVSKINFHQGALAINKFEKIVCTTHYQPYLINRNIIVDEFLVLVLRNNFFKNHLNFLRAEGIKNEATYEFIGGLKVPLPSIAEQKAILDDYQQKIENAKQQEAKAQTLEQSIEKYLFEELGIDFGTKIRNKNILNTIDYNKIDRWSVDYLNKFSRLSFLSKIKYPVVKLRTIVNNFQYGLSEKAVLENIGLPMIRMNNIFNSKLLLKDLKYLKNDIKFEKYILNKGDLLFNRTNSKELVGKTAVFNEDERYTFASYLIRVVMNNDKSDVNYINYLFNSKILKIQKDMVSRQITGQANINSQEMLDFLFPLPPLEKQKEIAEHISAIKDNIKSLKQNAETLKAEAEKEFEEKIFN